MRRRCTLIACLVFCDRAMDASASSAAGLSSARLGALLLAAAASGGLATWAVLRTSRRDAESASASRGRKPQGDAVVLRESGLVKENGGVRGAPFDAPKLPDSGRNPAPACVAQRSAGGLDAPSSRMSSIDLGHVGPWSGYGAGSEADLRRATGARAAGLPPPPTSAPFSGPVRSASSSRPRRESSAPTDPACVPFWWPTPSAPREDPLDPRPRERYLSWDDYFMSIAFLSAQRSKDPNKQVGAVVVDRKHVIAGIGYNGFPRGCSDQALPWRKIAPTDGSDDLGTKYLYVVHAETNAILNANRAGLEGSSIYVTLFPCNECAKLLIQVGIREVVYHEGKGEAGGRGGLVPRVDSAGGGGQGGFDGTETSVFGRGDTAEDGRHVDREDDGREEEAEEEEEEEAQEEDEKKEEGEDGREGVDKGRGVERAGSGIAYGGGAGRLKAPSNVPVSPNGSFSRALSSRGPASAAVTPRASRDVSDSRQSPFASGGSGHSELDDDANELSPLSSSTSSSFSTGSSGESAKVAGGEPGDANAQRSSPSSSQVAAIAPSPPAASPSRLPTRSRRALSLHASSNPFSPDFDRAASGQSLQVAGTPIPSRAPSYAALGSIPLLGSSHPSSSSPAAPDLGARTETGEERTGDEEAENGEGTMAAERDARQLGIARADSALPMPAASPARPIPTRNPSRSSLRGGELAASSPLRSPARPDVPRARFSPSGSLYASSAALVAPERRATAELRAGFLEDERMSSGVVSAQLAPLSSHLAATPSSPSPSRVPSSPMLTHRTLRAAKKAKAARDAQYCASRRMLAMAGVAVRQHKFEHEP